LLEPCDSLKDAPNIADLKTGNRIYMINRIQFFAFYPVNPVDLI